MNKNNPHRLSSRALSQSTFQHSLRNVNVHHHRLAPHQSGGGSGFGYGSSFSKTYSDKASSSSVGNSWQRYARFGRHTKTVQGPLSSSNSFTTLGNAGGGGPGGGAKGGFNSRIAGSAQNKSMAPTDNVSVYSNNLRDRIKEAGHPLRGPTMLQMTIHYT
ncbi:hypothetical protein HDU76_008401, partial [Blyttiomyces sp. JEL0837]